MSEVPDIYINSVRIDASIYEFVLTCSVITPEGEGGRSSRDLVRLRMSPQHAQALSILLEKHLNKFGEKFGAIALPQELMNLLTADEQAPGDGEEGKEEKLV